MRSLPSRPLNRSLSTSTATVFALAITLLTAGCVPLVPQGLFGTPAASESASENPSNGASPSPSLTAPPVALPTCETMYSAALVGALTADGREPQNDVSAPYQGGWGTLDPGLQTLLASIDERVSCTWILPASESGSSTTIARLDDASRATLLGALASTGYTSTATADGELWTLFVEDEFIVYTEAHLVTDSLWIGSFFSFGDAETLTLDAAAQLLP